MQIVPGKDDWGDVFRQIGGGASQGYLQQSDENSVREAVTRLGPNASARDILNALTNVHTYSPEAKQTALKNFIGVEELEATKQKAEIERLKQAKEKEAEQGSALELVNQSSLSDEVKEELSSKIAKGQLNLNTVKEITGNKELVKRNEKVRAANLALSTIDKMKQIRKGGLLGRSLTAPAGASYSHNAEARKAAGKYSQLGKSLIQISTDIPIRNRQEFETFAHDLYDPNISDAAAEGILEGLEERIMEALEDLHDQSTKSKTSEKRKPLSAFERG